MLNFIEAMQAIHEKPLELFAIPVGVADRRYYANPHGGLRGDRTVIRTEVWQGGELRNEYSSLIPTLDAITGEWQVLTREELQAAGYPVTQEDSAQICAE